METKYTVDGKKVIVIDSLKGCQYLVQEIYIKPNGNEVESGKPFVVSELYDEKLETWHDVELKKLKARYEREKMSIGEKISTLHSEYKIAYRKLSPLTTYIKKLIKCDDCSNLTTLIDFLNGDIKYLVMGNYISYQIVEFNNIITNPDKFDNHSLKLISLFGGSDGDLTYRLHDYSDGSGGYRTIIPCNTYEDATNVLDGLFAKIEGNRIAQSHIDAKLKYGLVNPVDSFVKEFNKNKIKTISKSLNKLETDKSKLQNQLSELVNG